MSKRTNDARRRMSSSAQNAGFFIWPLSESAATPDEMNTSFGTRIDADRWDFHDGIDLPAALGTPVHAMADGTVHRAGPADEVFGSTHVRLKVVDPTDGQDNLFLIYLHLDSIAEGIFPGAKVKQGDIIGAVGQEDATYPHLHFEFRKGGPEQVHSVHPLHYLPYLNKANFRKLRLDRCNFYREGGDKRMVRLRFDLADRREGDLLGVDVEVTGEGVDPRKLRVDFDDRNTIVSDKGDQHAFNEQGIAVEGYQKSNLKGEGRNDLHYGVLVKDITPEFKSVRLQVLDVENGKPKSAEFSLPTLGIDEKPINSRAGFEESQAFPPARLGAKRPAQQCLSARPSCRSHRFAGPALPGPPECARETDPRRAALCVARQPLARSPDVLGLEGGYQGCRTANGEGTGDLSVGLLGRRRCGGCRLSAECQEQ
ncbi:MAG TPA: M23 family metallopeptidase [Terriglobia bacterium]|nr:M23 family metallopeptidase [Terriglobia bacterium]